MNIPTEWLKFIGALAGGSATLYYVFSIISTTAANWRIFHTLPNELKKQTRILLEILDVLRPGPEDPVQKTSEQNHFLR